jgi:hypothetical protein
MGVVIELGMISYNKIRLNSLTKSIIASCIENPEKNDIINLYNKNGIESDFEISTDDGLEISFTYHIDSFLGNLIGKDDYQIKVDIIGKKNDGKITYSKGLKNE